MSVLGPDDIERIKEIVAPLKTLCEAHERTLYGDGHRGLVAEISEIRGFARLASMFWGLAIGIGGWFWTNHQ